jgi:hypothetical protein
MYSVGAILFAFMCGIFIGQNEFIAAFLTGSLALWIAAIVPRVIKVFNLNRSFRNG